MDKNKRDHSIIHFTRKPPENINATVLGVTGGIACGKSLICRYFKELGAALLSADELAREVVTPGTTVYHAIISRFGKEILNCDGAIDRKTLGEKIFAQPEKREELNRITHPAIAALSLERINKFREDPNLPLIIYEAPLLFEAKAEKRVDLVLLVTATPEKQLARLTERDQLSLEQAEQRICAQMPLSEKISRADIVLENNGPQAETKVLVSQIFTALIAGKKNPPNSGDF